MTTKSQTPRCGRPRRGDGIGKLCTLPAGWGTDHPGEGACRKHGGNTPRGADSPLLKTGIYSAYMKDDWRKKAEGMDIVLDLLPELSLMRVALADYIQRYQKLEWVMTGEDVETIRALVDTIRKVMDSIFRQRHMTALTAVEMAMLADKIPLLVVKYVSNPEAQRAFIAELFGVTGDGTEGFSSPELTSGVIKSPGRFDG